MIIDTHCHLNMKGIIERIDEVIENSIKNNVLYIHTICTKIEEYEEIKHISDKYHNVFCSVGMHPCNVDNSNIPSKELLLKLSKHSKTISFGETGLDYYHSLDYVSHQKKSFENHINASQEEKLPIIVHMRDSENDTYDILSNEIKNKEFNGVIHCFTSTEDFAKKMLDLGFYISIAGIITFKNAINLQETVKKIPLDRILVETDAPYLAPTPFRGKINEPAYTKYTLEFIADLHSVTVEKAKEITTNNAKNLFTKADFLDF